MTARRRIVVTGTSVISCLGNDPELFYDRLLQGESGIRPIDSFPCEEFPTRFAGFVHEFDPSDLIDKKLARRADRCISFGIWSGKKALLDAGFSLDGDSRIDPARSGVIIGTGIGGMQTFYDNSKALLEKGPRRVSPFLIPYILTNMPGALLAQDLGFMGPNYSVSTACATSNYAITLAAEHIARGEVDLMITGGVEASVTPIGLAGFCSVKALSERNDDPERASRPWDRNRDGFVMGEGAGVLVLEALDTALKRGAPILAEYIGGSMSCDAYHMTEPRPDGKGVALCIERALENAGIKPSDISYINAHATSTPVGDVAELNALLRVFDNPSAISMNATKSMIGHALGAAGGLEAVVLIKAIQTGKIHPTINLDNPEEISFKISSKAEECKIRYAMSNSFGFGGHNSTIIFAPYTAL
ncbi:MAG: beta-ketoacyl-ACP synthase II [Chlamydia sp.]